MTKAFTVSQIKDAAEKFREIATKLDSVAQSLADVNPNVLIVIGEEGGGNSSESGINRIQNVLRSAGKPISKKDILKRLEPKLSEDTLTSYLSRNKNLFKNPSRGVWTLAGMTTKSTEQK